jgi:hypothetical protein
VTSEALSPSEYILKRGKEFLVSLLLTRMFKFIPLRYYAMCSNTKATFPFLDIALYCNSLLSPINNFITFGRSQAHTFRHDTFNTSNNINRRPNRVQYLPRVGCERCWFQSPHKTTCVSDATPASACSEPRVCVQMCPSEERHTVSHN